MLSTVPSLVHNDIKPLHAYSSSSSFKPPASRYSPPESPRSLPPFINVREEKSSMNNPHRGLPPPVGLSLPPPNDRSTSALQSIGHLPAPPSQWSGAEESMRQWLQAKVEEDRRKQEEERTKQEGLRLDQRRIEQNMLSESLRGGVPPPMVPLIFAGIGGGNLPSHTLEWAQQYLASLSLQNQQQQQQIQAQKQQIQQFQPASTPEMHRGRVIPANPYGPAQSQPNVAETPAQQSSQSRNLTIGPQPAPNLARLNTADFQPQSTSSANPARPQLQPAQSAHSDQSGPGLFFHHWTPPASNQPPTPSGKSTQSSPFSQHNPSHLRSEYQGTPKKRKTTTGSVAAGPTSQPLDLSPHPSSRRSSRDRETPPHMRSKQDSRRHSRQESDGSAMDIEPRPIARPSSRQQRMEEGSGGPP